MKRRFAPLLLIAPLALLAACGGGTPALTLNANWYSDPTHNIITGTLEELTYTVAQKEPSKAQALRFVYNPGTYTTRLEDCPLNAYGVDAVGYHYHTELAITGTYFYNGVGTSFSDSVVSDVWFLDVHSALRPVRSEKRVQATVANIYADASTNKLVDRYRYDIIANYNSTKDKNPTKTEVTFTDHASGGDKTEEYSLSLSGSSTFFDNEQILFALRAVDVSKAFAFRTVNPIQRAKMDVSSASEAQTVQLTPRFTVGGVAQTGDIPARKISIGYTGTRGGRQQTLWYAAALDNVPYRAVLLRMEVELPEELGVLSYDLSEAKFAK